MELAHVYYCETFVCFPTVNCAGVGSGVHQEVDGLHLHQAGAELAGRSHARKQKEEAGRR